MIAPEASNNSITTPESRVPLLVVTVPLIVEGTITGTNPKLFSTLVFQPISDILVIDCVPLVVQIGDQDILPGLAK